MVPFPLPLLPEVTVIQLESLVLLAALHEQPSSVATATLPLELRELNDLLVSEIE